MENQQNWYKSFFSGLALEMWDNALPQAFTHNEVKFIKEVSGIKPGARILDVPCGSGRLSVPLAREGFLLCAIDISEGNIETLTQLRGNLAIELMCQDILTCDLPDGFDLAICMGNSFSYFPFQQMVIFATKVRAALKRGGKFIINSGAVAESLLPNLKDKLELKLDDLLFSVENHYDATGSVLRSDMQFIKGAATERRTAYHFVFTLAEVQRILALAGFSDFEIYSDASRSVYKLGSHQAYIVAS